MRAQKFMDDCNLKTTDILTVTQNDRVDISVTDDEINASSYEKPVKTKVVSVDLTSLTQT